jgi:predicted nucleic acid-binding protein
VAATAAEHVLTLCTSNAKRFSPIRDLKIRVFKPGSGEAARLLR